MRDANGNFVDMLGHLDTSINGQRAQTRLKESLLDHPIVMDPNDPNPLGRSPEEIEASSAPVLNVPKIEDWSEKRLVQTSTPYHSRFDALDACAGSRALDGCEYAYVDGENRVVGIYRYYDVAPDEPVLRGQRRVIIPKPRHHASNELGAVAERIGISWSTGDELNKLAARIERAHPGATFTVKTDVDPTTCKQLHLTITIPE